MAIMKKFLSCFSLLLCIVVSLNAQISTTRLGSDLDDNTYSFDVFCLQSISNSKYAFNKTIQLKIKQTLYIASNSGEPLVRLTCWDYNRSKEIKIYLNAFEDYFIGSGLGDYGCALGCIWNNKNILSYLRKRYSF